MSSDEEELVLRRPSTRNVDVTGVRSSSRRLHSGQQHVEQDAALEAIRLAHKTGRVQRRDVTSLQKPVYEEVDEEEYQRIVRERQENDFVVDDDGSGYVDHGLDIFDEDQMLENAEEPMRRKLRAEKRKKKGLTDYFSSTVNTRKDDSTVTLGNDPDVEALLNEMDFDNPLKESYDVVNRENIDSGGAHVRNPFKRPTSPGQITPAPIKLPRLQKSIPKAEDSEIQKYNIKSENSCAGDGCDDSDFILPDRTSSGEKLAEIESKRQETEVVGNSLSKGEVTLIRPALPETVSDIKSNVQAKASLEDGIVSGFQWESGDGEQAEVAEVSSSKARFLHTTSEGVEAIHIYWTDAFEDPVKFPGTVYLFGRVKNGNATESCCVIIRNIWRQVFFLPCEQLDDGKGTNQVDVNVYNEVHTLLEQYGINTMKCRPTMKKFAYNDGFIPKIASVLEVQYSSKFPALPSDLKGSTFSHVFNTSSTAMERLLLETNMKGPCWLEIENCVESVPKVSYVKHEYVVDMERMKSLHVLSCTFELPTITVLGLNVISAVNEAMENEIVMISCIYDKKCDLEKPTTATSQLERFCFLTKPSNRTLPLDLKAHLKRNGLEAVVKEASNERHLLSQFLCKLQTLDPDSYLGHDLSAQFSTLVARLEKFKIANWSCLGRLRRSVPLKKMGHTKASHWELTAGRFCLDSRLAAMELVKLRSYDLSEMAELLLHLNCESVKEIIEQYSSGQMLTNLINSSFYDTWLSLSIIANLNALPLFLKITQIVGGVLSRTLMGGRAERNEFLLLHAFYKSGYVPPDKYQKDKKKKLLLSDRTDAENEAPEKLSKKAQYSGGLVLEPKKGLYDTFILLLDFNSLYPSIIQEYNICFTTVDQSKHMESDADVPSLPEDSEEGILPREIRSLVEQRREVKKLMKSREISEQLRSQYNIRQMGLKLTANSMYGCLGFVQSRFYAKPLAAMITSCGREILIRTKDLVEKMGYSVIYGDTDSIMIDTGLLDLEQVKKIGFEVKKLVNKSYKKLELDLDGVYKRLLLLKKKKYVGLAVDLTTGEVRREAKGLDIIRRDWSLLAKDVGNEVVDIILSDMDRDDRIEKIHETLAALKEKMEGGTMDISKFEILKAYILQLTRGVEEYGDCKAQPHVAVAQRLNGTGKFHFHRGDTVPYIICEDGTSNSAVQRAYHRSEILGREDLHVDLHYYLAQQVHPVVCRICEPIEGTDAVRIAESLGLDPTTYRSRVHTTGSDGVDEFTVGAELDYSTCDPFIFFCPYENCGKEVVVRETFCQDESGAHLWVDSCPECSRTLLPFSSYLNNQLSLSILSYIKNYYTPLYVCDDTLCGFRTRRLPFRLTREGIHCPKCSYGLLRREYTAKQLYIQQCFYRSLFDLKKAVSDCKLNDQRRLKTRRDFPHLVQLHRDLTAVCDKYLLKNDFGRVSLPHLFASMFSD